MRKDGTSGGNDYWMGAGGRDWMTFLGIELVDFVKYKWGIENENLMASGISMGAHGAMKLAVEFPEVYKSFTSLSPVFRSTYNEIPKVDREVF